MKELLERLIARESLSVDDSSRLMHQLLTGEIAETEIAAVLMVLRMRGTTLDELDGFASAVAELCTPLDLSEFRLIDVCGTGGDGKDSFNISTAVAFVLAGAGYQVAKHGNYAVSSSCGSSNVLEALGVRFSDSRDDARRKLERVGVCFLHAPLFHPLLKRVQPVRKSLKVRTVFNMLGPLVNPAKPEFHCTGVYDLELLRLYSYFFTRRGRRFAVVHSFDGYDEISLTGASRVSTAVGAFDLWPQEMGLDAVQPEQIAAGETVEASAALLTRVLSGAGTRAQEQVVVANAAVAMWQYEERDPLLQWVERARETIRSGRALDALRMSVE